MERAVACAAAAGTLEELRGAIAAFDGCGLRNTASNLVFAEGDPAANLVLIRGTFRPLTMTGRARRSPAQRVPISTGCSPRSSWSAAGSC